MLDLNPGSGEFRRPGQFAGDRKRTLRQGVLRKLAAVDAGPGERKKHKTLLHPPRIVLETGYFQIGQLRRERFAERHPRQQLAELHRPN